MRRINRSRVFVIVVGALAVALTTQAVVLAASTLKSGRAITAVRTASDLNEVNYFGSAWTTVAGMTTTIGVPAGEKGLLLVTFSAQTTCNDFDSSTSDSVFCMARILVDGQEASPGPVIFDSGGDAENNTFSWEANSMQWVIGPLPAGTYTVTAQVRLDEAASHFDLAQRTLTVLRSKV